MKARILFFTAILPLLALAQPLLSAAAPATEKSAAPQLSAEQKLAQYRHDQINLLALRADAPSLLAAALLATPDAADKTRPGALQTPALLERAQKFGADSALVWWVTAALECKGKPKDCPTSDTLQKLEQLDPSNGAVWILSMWRAQQSGDDVTARAALTSAAQTKHYDDYFGAIILTIYSGEAILPMSSELLNATGQDASVDGFRLITAAGIAAGLVKPENTAMTNACKSTDNADAAWVTDCISVARTMADSGSLFTRQIGLDLLESLSPSGQAHADAVAQSRLHQWKMLQISQLGGRLANDSRVTRIYVGALRQSSSESAAVDAVLRSQGVALAPPADWQPDASAGTPDSR